ncbi:unnamed protein product, partial [Polarella glacialis]
AEAERQALLAAMRSRSGALMEWHHSRGREKWLATQSFTSWKMQVRSLRWARSYALSSVVSSDLALIRQVLAELRRFVVVTRNQRAADGDEARLGALDQLQSRLVTWHSDRGLDRLLLVQTIGAWRNVSLDLRTAVCACFVREAGCDQALLAVILAEWRLLLRQTAREHAVALNGELRAQCHWRATLVLASRQVGESEQLKAVLFSCWRRQISCLKAAMRRGRLRQDHVVSLALASSLSEWRLQSKEQLWRRKQQEMASLLAQAGAQLVEAGRREVRQGRAANNGTRLASSNMGPRIACLRSDLDASRALAAWSRAAVQLRAERLGDERTSEFQAHGEQMTLQ